MKIAYKHFSMLLETTAMEVGGIVVEHQQTMYRFLMELREAMEGRDSGVVLSEDNRVLEWSKNAELLTDFICFDLNQKGLVTKIISTVDKISESEEFYNKSQQLLAQIERYIMDMTVDFPCGLACEKLTIQSILKGVGLSIVDEYTCLEERLLAFMDLVHDFLGKKLFILVNVRGIIASERLQKLVDTALLREHEILFIDNREYPKLKQEKRILIDEDMCEI